MSVVTIGDATLYHGDALDVLRGMRSDSVDMVFTDPPYGINTKSDGSGKLNPWADLCNSAYWYAAWIGECRRILKPTGCMWSCLNWRSVVTFQKAACDLAWSIESLAIWDKRWIGPGGCRGLRPSYEMVALWCGPDFAIPDRGIPDIVAVPWSGHKPNGHPAEKPPGLVRWCIQTAALPVGSVVVDPFSGSGTTAEVCTTEGMRFIGSEIDDYWFGYTQKRIRRAVQDQRSQLPLEVA